MHDNVRRRPLSQHGQRDVTDDPLALVAELSVTGERDDVFPQRVEELPDGRRVRDGPEPGISPLRSRVDDPYDTAVSAPGLARAAVRPFDPWNQSVGLAWADVLRASALDPQGIVAEVGPGFTDKVGHGLAALGFRGTLLLIEPTTSARRWACERYRALLPMADVIGVPARVAEAASWTDIADIDAVVSNHVLDDMLLCAAVGPATRDVLFGGMRPDAPCTSPFVNAWTTLVQDTHRLERARTAVVDELTGFVGAARPRVVAFREYPSWTHQTNGLAFIHAQTERVMADLEVALRNIGLHRLRVPDAPGPDDETAWLLMSWERRP
jgi:hypothetical protein